MKKYCTFYLLFRKRSWLIIRDSSNSSILPSQLNGNRLWGCIPKECDCHCCKSTGQLSQSPYDPLIPEWNQRLSDTGMHVSWNHFRQVSAHLVWFFIARYSVITCATWHKKHIYAVWWVLQMGYSLSKVFFPCLQMQDVANVCFVFVFFAISNIDLLAFVYTHVRLSSCDVSKQFIWMLMMLIVWHKISYQNVTCKRRKKRKRKEDNEI